LLPPGTLSPDISPASVEFTPLVDAREPVAPWLQQLQECAATPVPAAAGCGLLARDGGIPRTQPNEEARARKWEAMQEDLDHLYDESFRESPLLPSRLSSSRPEARCCPPA